MGQLRQQDLNSFDDFLEAIKELRQQSLARRAQYPHSRLPGFVFRGQHDASWKLETTLERHRPRSLSAAHYYTAISAAKSQIEAHTQQRWDIENANTYRDTARTANARAYFKTESPGYDYMAYLRHHGFPSPLLDWTASPYIGAFFAFREAADPEGRVAVFAYREMSAAGKITRDDAPWIAMRGPYVRTHRRHFLQQCYYTVCMQFKEAPLPQWYYTLHDEVFDAGSSAPAHEGQDELLKFTIPRSERQRALAYLDEHNLNAYSLFGSDETLMEMMARRELNRDFGV